jgi:N-carbamoyl-L-amino-acid hydrolase
VRHTIELRDLDPQKIHAIGDRIRTRAAAIAAETHTDIAIRLVEHDDPAIASPKVQAAIEDAAKALGLTTIHLPSGAGHDASPMATIAPMGMIFAPSVGGVSHSPRELTTWEDCANGADVLLGTVVRLDRSL